MRLDTSLKEKIDFILYSHENEPEKKFLVHKIDLYYNNLLKNKLTTQIIECDFKTKQIIACFEYLTNEILEKIF